VKARRRPSALAEVTPPDHLLGPGRTIPAHATDEDRARSEALHDWLDERGLIAHGVLFTPGLIDPIDDLLMGPIHHPGETWEAFVSRLIREDEAQAAERASRRLYPL
jgi:hypothetical protein